MQTGPRVHTPFLPQQERQLQWCNPQVTPYPTPLSQIPLARLNLRTTTPPDALKGVLGAWVIWRTQTQMSLKWLSRVSDGEVACWNELLDTQVQQHLPEKGV